MNREELIQKYHTTLQTLNAYQLALNTVSYDDLTVAPKAGRDYRGTMISILSGEFFQKLQSEETYTLLQAMDALDDLDEITMKSVKELLKELNKTKNIPLDEYVAYSKLLQDSNNAWESAREENDYPAYQPTLANVIEVTKKLVAYRQDQLTPYNSLLNDYEEGLNQTMVDNFFKVINDRLVPFIHKIKELNLERPAFLSRHVDRKTQIEVTNLIMEYTNYSSEFAQNGESAHPFSTNMSINDVRVTTHYYEDNFTSNIFSMIHEIGHATYNHQVNPAFEGTPLANNMSYSMHESQSRLMENMLGRTPAFWKTLYPRLQTILTGVLDDVSFDEFIAGINFVETSLIRTEADELTYPLHILIRYQIESRLFNNEIDTFGLDKVWADEYERVLGVRPLTASEGVLQDVHWSQASFGYFPTYALGSAYAAQFMHTMRQQINVDQALETNNMRLITEWLRTNIHVYSGSISADEVLRKVTGESFNPNYYCDYLIEKYSHLYGLK